MPQAVQQQVSANHTYADIKRQAIVLSSLALLSLAIKALLAFNTFGTNDMLGYRTFMEESDRGPRIHMYQQDSFPEPATLTTTIKYPGPPLRTLQFNHPPFIISFLRGLGVVSAVLKLPFQVTFRLMTSLADSASFLLVCLLTMKRPGVSSDLFRALALMAICPSAILIAGFHGNTDPVLIFFVLLSVWLLERKNSVLLAGASLGMALNIKVAAVILIPTLLLYIPTWRKRMVCLCALSTVFLIPTLPYLLQDARAVIHYVFMYNSAVGVWGFSYCVSRLHLQDTIHGFRAGAKYAKYPLLIAITIFPWWLNRHSPRFSLFNQFGVIFSFFLFFSPGFGIQYLYWLVPWAVGLGAGLTALQYLCQGVFVFLVYNSWCHGMPWFFAVAEWPWWQGWLSVLQLVAWASVGAAVYVYMNLIRNGSRPAINPL